MAETLILYTNPMSRGRVARWMIEETGAPYQAEVMDFTGPTRSPEYLAINPLGKVPALRHGDVIVTETAAICAYLADTFPEAGLAPPPGDPLRGAYYRWLFFGAGPLEAAITNHALGFTTPPDRESMAGYGSLVRVLDVLDARLSRHDMLVGDRFSAADLYVGAQISFGLQFKMIEPRPAFERYATSLARRPAAERARQIDD